MTGSADSATPFESPYRYRRLPTRVVSVGGVDLGGETPIRVQSMTISHTHDAAATAAEIEELVSAGCEIVRMTVASRSDASALHEIVDRVRSKGIETPFVADIHFAPHLAMDAVEVVEKVRINPGNFVDRKKFDAREIPEDEFEAAVAKVREAFAPLVRRARERGVAIRVGVNHGSLADRMVNRYGDSPLGMVESALEYLRVCVEEDFGDVVISMKSSNPIVMIQAYRLLVARMQAESMCFPIHLGVTEAGEGREGRVKSSIGIGTLLEDGIGDTIRVSLTESATRMVTRATFQALTGGPVIADLWAEMGETHMGHLEAADDADLFVVAPATADFLAKAAAGIADDALTTALVASDCPVLVAPAMNPRMWANPIVQRNVKTLLDFDFQFIGPVEGRLAEGVVGVGRMSEPEDIAAEIDRRLGT